MPIDRTLQIIQMAYPQVYLTCHTRHQRRQSTPNRLSPRDSAILSHLDRTRGTTPARLAVHLGISASTLSEALKRLTQHGYVMRVARAASKGKRGGSSVLLSEKGATAITATSVLEASRLKAVLEQLSSAERLRVETGMNTLANACRKWNEKSRAKMNE